VCAGTTVQYVNNKTSTAALVASDKLSYAEIKKAKKTLKNHNVRPLEDGCYIGLIDPDTESDLMDDPMWIDVSKYNGGTKIMEGEIGKLAGVRFVVTTETLIKEGASSLPVHCTMIVGEGAYGVVDVEGSTNKPKVIIKPFGSSGTEDPLNQRQTMGWKAMFTAIRLNELAMVRIEHAVSE
jgi:N4-gp56 family major capsid protein